MPPRSRRASTPPTPPMQPLTPAQWAFVRHYVAADESSGSRALAAYRQAYPARNGTDDQVRADAHRLLRRPNVAAAVAELEADQARSRLITRDMVLGRLLTNAEEARAAGDYQAVARSLELVGKAIGMWEPRGSEAALDLLHRLRALSQPGAPALPEPTITVESTARDADENDATVPRTDAGNS